MKLYPLSYQQKKLYNYSKVHVDDTEYNVLQGIILKKKLKREHFERVINRLLVEEPILRCQIIEKKFTPFQYVANFSDYKIVYRDIISKNLEAEIKKIKNKPFNLDKDPLFQVIVFTQDNGETVLIFKLHHIVCDGWSFQLLIKKFTRYYFSTDINNISNVQQSDYTYYDYANEQTSPDTIEKYTEKLSFWKKIMNNGSSKLTLPYSFPRKKEYTNVGNRRLYHVSRKLSNEINIFCKEQKISVFTLLVSIYGDLFSRLSSEKKLNIAVPVANRFRKKDMKICGYFINTIPLFFDFSEKSTVQERLISQQKEFIKELSKSDVDIDCLCNVMFVFQNRPELGEMHEAEDLEYLRLNNGKSKYDVSLSVMFEKDHYVFEWEYMCELFSESAIGNFNQYFLQLLNNYMTHHNKNTSQLSILNDSEVKLQKEVWNKTSKKFPDSNKTIKELFEQTAKIYENYPAIIFNNKSLSYGEFNRLVNGLCQELSKIGIKKGEIIPILFDRSFEMVVAIYAILKLGCAYLPLDTEMPFERMKFILTDSKSEYVLTTKAFSFRFPDDIKTFNVNIENLKRKNANPKTITNVEDKAYVIYTSGSTGSPKGVVNTQAGLVNRLLWMKNQFSIKPNTRILHKTPYTFDVSVWELICPLISGATVVIAKPGGHRDPDYIANIIALNKIEITHFVPSMLKTFLGTDECKKCKSLQFVICSGESLDEKICIDFYKKIDAQLVNLYGPTEAAIDVSCWMVKPENIGSVIPIGKPISNMKLYKLNDSLMFEPPEVPGELYIAGVGLAKGYLNNQQKTKENFLECPWLAVKQSNLIYKTGDIVRIDKNGNFIYLNRKDFQVKIRGQRVELAEIENNIRKLDFVDDAVVIVKSISKGQQILVAFVKASKEDKRAITIFLEQHLPAYMIPHIYYFIDEIPKNTNGKIDRKELLEYQVAVNSKKYDKPQNCYEYLVCSAVSQVLGILKISRDANFYDLGGTSLSIYDVKIVLEKKLQKKISLEPLLGKETVKDMAAALRDYLTGDDVKSYISKFRYKSDSIQDISYEKRVKNESNKNVFMTGATGFLGAYLLHQYLETTQEITVICLIRAKNEKLGFKRVKDNMLYWEVWKDEYENRLRIFCGDLAQNNLGLSQGQIQFLNDKIDIICHNGANVNFALTYDQVRKTNVEGTKRILKILESGKRKCMAYVSTISIFAQQDYEKGIIMESQQPLDVNNLRLGYSKSKCIAESILREYVNKNYDIEVFRVGRVMGVKDGGKENKDMFYKLLSLCRQMKIFPDISINFNGIPVDEVSNLIVYASLYKKQANVYHVVNADVNISTKLSEFFPDSDMAKVSWKVWYRKCIEYSDTGDALARQVMVSINENLAEKGGILDLRNAKALAKEAKIKISGKNELIQKLKFE